MTDYSECGLPPLLSSGIHLPQQSYYSVGDVVTYQCFSPFTLNGINTNECQDDGTWSNDAPECSNEGKS